MTSDSEQVEHQSSCFVISEIGEEGSDQRKRADKIFEYVIAPAAEEAGFSRPERADRITEPGMITNQIIGRLIEADVVICDLTGLNPNVLYELAWRHIFKKSTLHIFEPDTRIPFDVAPIRYVDVGTDIEVATKAKSALSEMLKRVKADPSFGSESPFGQAIDLTAFLAESRGTDSEPVATLLQELSTEIGKLRAQVAVLQTELFRIAPSTGSAGRRASGFSIPEQMGMPEVLRHAHTEIQSLHTHTAGTDGTVGSSSAAAGTLGSALGRV